MKKFASLMLASAVLAGCAQPAEKGSVTAQDLQHHRFVLESVDGKPLDVKNSQRAPELSFGENLHISGAMCNRFMGQGILEGDTLKAKGMGMTMMLCVEPQLNELDHRINEMMTAGAKVSLANQRLVLKSGQHTLTYKLADLVN
ncbi:Heat shock protein hslJ [Cedecea lapagei]|uniref:Heat shock protein hslJ n=1 Tax=Cedecea lapagei TaxID=158823 RepID=A0A3S4MFB9_9ENTR|nr:heat shock protein HslJ [Cedecea lapagei]VEB97412.1 Heat shock protein hslJ [Cedecea lapagei]